MCQVGEGVGWWGWARWYSRGIRAGGGAPTSVPQDCRRDGVGFGVGAVVLAWGGVLPGVSGCDDFCQLLACYTALYDYPLCAAGACCTIVGIISVGMMPVTGSRLTLPMDTPVLSGLARRIVQEELLDVQTAGKASKQAS